MKKTVTLSLAAIVSVAAIGAVWVTLPFVKIRGLDSRFGTTARGMKVNEVFQAMGSAASQSTSQSSAWWDDRLLGSDEDARVHSAIRYEVETFYMPAIFEFTFDEAGVLVGRHRYD